MVGLCELFVLSMFEGGGVVGVGFGLGVGRVFVGILKVVVWDVKSLLIFLLIDCVDVGGSCFLLMIGIFVVVVLVVEWGFWCLMYFFVSGLGRWILVVMFCLVLMSLFLVLLSMMLVFVFLIVIVGIFCVWFGLKDWFLE